MKVKESFLKFLKVKRVKKTIIGVLALVVIILCVLPFISNDKPKANTEFLNSLLTKSSELTSAKLNITGFTKYTDTGIAVINKSNFSMLYNATIRAGINIEKVKVSADDVNKIIYISIPKAEVQDAKVDPSTIKYFDEKFALFNFDEKKDANRAQAFAEKAAKKEAVNTGILELANTQSETLIKGILANSIPDGYEIKVK